VPGHVQLRFDHGHAWHGSGSLSVQQFRLQREWLQQFRPDLDPLQRHFDVLRFTDIFFEMTSCCSRSGAKLCPGLA